jgi:O-antigen ligase
MSKLFSIDDSLTNKISFYHILLFVASLPFDRFYSEVILASLVIHTLIHFRKSSLLNYPFKKILLLQSIFLLTVIASIHTLSISLALKEWEQQLAIFLFPLLFSVTQLDLKKYRRLFFTALTAACTSVIVYLEYDAVRIIHFYHLSYSALFSNAFINWNFSNPMNIHPTYLSMYVALSIVFMLSCLVSATSMAGKVMFTSIAAVLSIGLLQLGSKSVLFAFLLIVILSPFFLPVSGKRKPLLLIAIVLGLSTLVVFKYDALQNRFISSLADDLTKEDSGKTKNEFRIARWKAGLDLVRQSPIIGFGTGSEITMLKKKYFERKLYSSFINNMNVHSQYLSLMIRAGVIGLLMFLLILYKGFDIAIKSKDFMMLSFLMLIAIVSLCENIFDVNKGIFFYSSFFSLFIFTSAAQRVPLDIERKAPGKKRRFYDKQRLKLAGSSSSA